ncbi:MAG: hypothetical protein FJ387_00065 [Verrucomicrobia bacterium]|nr:hypothetical protein [Verrucomicrobiota bacterium]
MDFRRLIRAALWLVVPATAFAADDIKLPADWRGSLHGFGLVNYSVQPDLESSPDSDGLGGHGFLLGEERLQLKLEARSPQGAVHLLAKPEFHHDAVDETFGADLREGYLDYARDAWGLRLGRQILTWGVGDLVFINDVFPKDYAAFFSGRPLEYLKLGVDGLSANVHTKGITAEFVVVPPGLFTPNQLPPRERFHQFDPFPLLPRETDEPDVRIENTELALRLYRTLAETEVSLYAYHGFWRNYALEPDDPSMPAAAIEFYPRLVVFGASARRAGLGGVLGAETGYYYSADDPSGTRAAIENSQLRFLLTYQRQIARDFIASLEYYGEWMQNFDAYRRTVPAGFPQRPQWRDLIGLRLTKLLHYQTFKLSWFSFYSPMAGGFFLNPELSYQFTDGLWAALGGSVFGGPTDSFLGQLGRNDIVYATVRYSF